MASAGQNSEELRRDVLPTEDALGEVSDTQETCYPGLDEDQTCVKRRRLDKDQTSDLVNGRRLNSDAILEVDTEQEAETGDDCSICLAPLATQNHQCRVPSCGHCFHTACILEAFCRSGTPACPYCRGIGDAEAAPADSGNCNEGGGDDPSALMYVALELGTEKMTCLDKFSRIDGAELRPLALAMEKFGRRDFAHRRQAPAPAQQPTLQPRCEPKPRLCSHGHQYLFGREEVRGRLPRPVKKFERYISRHLFIMSQSLPGDVDNNLQHRRQVDGDDVAVSGDGQGPTVFVEGISNGVHVRAAGQGTWKWLPLGQAFAAGRGDRIALLLEAPPGAFSQAQPQDYTVDTASAILFFDIA